MLPLAANFNNLSNYLVDFCFSQQLNVFLLDFMSFFVSNALLYYFMDGADEATGMANDSIKIGMIGFGTVGAGVAKLLLDGSESIRKRTGLNLELAAVVDKDTSSHRPIDLPAGLLSNDAGKILNNDDICIGVELIGGTTAARDIQLSMLNAGKNVVTANKALLAEHGSEIYRVARENKKCVAFEASCAGGIPIISAIRSGLAANEIKSIFGIVNGTCNYILSSMTNSGLSFEQALEQAQQKGFAEADPTLDINGFDSAHKLVIMASIAFGCEIQMQDLFVEGIEGVSIEDINNGREMGYVLKLLAIGRRRKKGTLSLKVQPSFIRQDHALARVEGSFNAITIFGDAVGETMYYGRGAGMMPTASAVVADIIDVALGNSQKTFDHCIIRPRSETEKYIGSVEDVVSRYYVRLMAKDEPGVFSAYGKILGDNNISISGALQHEGTGPDNTVPVVIVTHPTTKKNMDRALFELGKLKVVSGKPVCIRIVDMPEDSD